MKKPEHPNMNGKTDEEILADAKPLIDDIRYLVDSDPSFTVWIGSQPYEGQQYLDEILSLSPLSRSIISSWHYSYDKDGAIARAVARKLPALKRSALLRLAAATLSGIAVILAFCMNANWAIARYSAIAISATTCATAAWFFYKKDKEIAKLEKLLFR